MRYHYKKAYLKRFDHFSHDGKELIIRTDAPISRSVITIPLVLTPYGLRIRKLYDKDKIFEARVSDKTRILCVESKDLVSFAIVGAHDEVRDFIKGFR